MRYYISDLHFYHTRMNEYMDKRGFPSVEEMNDHMIRMWNGKVRQNDDVVILGDLSIARGKDTNSILKKLNGNKMLITGNHDKFLKDKDFDISLFRWIRPYEEMNDNGRKVILSHYPIICYNGQYRRFDDGSPKVYMLYGHVHETRDYKIVKTLQEITRNTRAVSRNANEGFIPCNMINCFCMRSNYIPLTLDEWIALELNEDNGE